VFQLHLAGEFDESVEDVHKAIIEQVF
jgi:hypothetical protein